MTALTKRTFLKTILVTSLAASLPELTCQAADDGIVPLDLVEAVQKLRTEIDKVFKQEDLKKEVAIGMFTPADNEQELAAYGRRIAEQMRTELTSAGYVVKERAANRIFGQFRLAQSKEHFEGTISINVTVTKNTGHELKEIVVKRLLRTQTQVQDSKEFVLASTPTMPIEPNASFEQLVQEVEKVKLLENEQPALAPLQPAGDSVSLQSLGVRMRLVTVDPQQNVIDPRYVVSAIAPSKPQDGGLPLYRLSESQPFAIELYHQRENIRLAAEVFIDGVSSFALADPTGPRYNLWAVKERSLISGWFRNLQSTQAFQAVPDRESVAYRLGQTIGMGTIQVLFYAAWTDAEASLVSSKFRKRGLTKRGIGAGKRSEVQLTVEPLNIGALVGSLSVRYTV